MRQTTSQPQVQTQNKWCLAQSVPLAIFMPQYLQTAFRAPSTSTNSGSKCSQTLDILFGVPDEWSSLLVLVSKASAEWEVDIWA